MTPPRVLVTGASGKTGSALVAELAGKDVRVRALVHRRDARSKALARLGAEVVVADLFDPVQMEEALRDVARVSFVPPWHPHALHAAVVLATAARDAGVEAIVGLTQWLAAPSHPALSTRQMWLVDRLFDLVPGAVHVTVRPGFFADNYLATLPLAALFGVLPFPTGGGRNAPPSTEDIARVMAAVLLDPARHAGRAYRPTGPALLGGDDMARLVGEALGRRVRHVDLPIAMFLRAVRVQGTRMGVDAYLQSQLRWFLEESRLGTWAAGAPTTDVRDLTGREPEAFDVIARRHALRPDARRTPGNLLRALGDALRIAVTPALDVTRFEARNDLPGPAMDELSGASTRWAREHGVRDPEVRRLPTDAGARTGPAPRPT